MDKTIKFEFISSYAGRSSYRIVRYGHPDHDKRIEIVYHVDPLYIRSYTTPNAVQKRFNYTPTEYTHMVARVKGYLYHYNATQSLDPEYAIAFDAQSRANWEAAKAKHPDFVKPYKRTILGTAHLVPTGKGEYDYAWQLVKV